MRRRVVVQEQRQLRPERIAEGPSDNRDAAGAIDQRHDCLPLLR